MADCNRGKGVDVFTGGQELGVRVGGGAEDVDADADDGGGPTAAPPTVFDEDAAGFLAVQHQVVGPFHLPCASRPPAAGQTPCLRAQPGSRRGSARTDGGQAGLRSARYSWRCLRPRHRATAGSVGPVLQVWWSVVNTCRCRLVLAAVEGECRADGRTRSCCRLRPNARAKKPHGVNSRLSRRQRHRSNRGAVRVLHGGYFSAVGTNKRQPRSAYLRDGAP